MHEHTWEFTLAAGGWSAACPCGLAVEVTIARDRSVWEWTLHGSDAVPPERMLAAIGSVMAARRALPAPARN